MVKLLPGALLIVIGLAVFTLPHWVPLTSDVRVEPEAFERSGQVGGVLIAIGLLATFLGWRAKAR